MSHVALFDLISLLGYLITLIILIKMWRKSFLSDANSLFATLILFSLVYSVALFLEWSGITAAFDPEEDVIGALLPMMWAFFFYSFLQNITTHDLRQSEQLLQESTRNLNNLMTNLPGMAYRCLNDRDWSMVFVSQGCLELTGFEPGDLLRDGKVSYGELIHMDDKDKVWGQMREKVDKKQPFQLVYRIRTATGEEKWVWEQGVGIISPVDGLLAVEGFITDITEQKLAQAALQKTHAKVQRAYDELEEKVQKRTAEITVAYQKYISYDKIYVIGDIHGSIDMLNKLMDIIPWRMDKDLLIFLGDYIDRRDHGKEVVDYIIELKSNSEYVRCLLGNHDAMFLDYLNGKNIDQYISNGGDTTLLNYGITNPEEGYDLVPEEHIRFFRSLEPYIELENYYFVHAGFRPGIEIKEQKLEDMLWIREDFIDSKYDFGKKVIFGHTPLDKPLIMKNKIGIDTSAGYGEKLTCLELPREKFYSVD
jgi:serine/threonine protein phosphatase 1